MIKISSLVYVFIGYLWGMLFSDYIHADLALTTWTNIWVYVWLFLWPLCLMWYFVFYVVGLFFIIGLIYLGWDEISQRYRHWKHLRIVRNRRRVIDEMNKRKGTKE